MGLSTDALVWYGYCWNEEEDLFDRGEDGDGDWETAFLAKKGIIRSEGEDFDSWWPKKEAAMAETAVEIDSHCSSDYPIPLVAIMASKVRAWRGEPRALSSLVAAPDWDEKLDEFCRLMGITPPEGQKPQWWLASDMG